MVRTMIVDGREVKLRASAAIPRLYRLKFRRDIIQDMHRIQSAMQQVEQAEKRGDVPESGASPEPEQAVSLPLEALTLFENVAYLMAKHGDPECVPDDVNSWLDSFETFSIYNVFPVIQELWEENLRTLNEPKKK